MTEPFYERAAAARERYLAFLRRAIDGLKAAERNVAVEVLVQPHGRTTPPPFCLLRVDAVLGVPPALRIQRVADEIDGQLPQRCVLASGMEIRQTGFSWEALRIVFVAPEFEIGVLKPWLQLWLDPDEIRKPDESGLSGVVHDLAWSYLELDRWQLDVDLGSAPLLALQELLDVLVDAGVARVDLSRRDAGGGVA